MFPGVEGPRTTGVLSRDGSHAKRRSCRTWRIQRLGSGTFWLSRCCNGLICGEPGDGVNTVCTWDGRESLGVEGRLQRAEPLSSKDIRTPVRAGPGGSRVWRQKQPPQNLWREDGRPHFDLIPDLSRPEGGGGISAAFSSHICDHWFQRPQDTDPGGTGPAHALLSSAEDGTEVSRGESQEWSPRRPHLSASVSPEGARKVEPVSSAAEGRRPGAGWPNHQ